MSRRDKTANTERPKALKRRSPAKIVHHRKPSPIDANEKIALLEHRLSEALEQQAATSEVLQVISSSPGNLDPVFQAMLAKATHLCEAKFGILFRYESGLFHPTASLDVPPLLPISSGGKARLRASLVRCLAAFVSQKG